MIWYDYFTAKTDRCFEKREYIFTFKTIKKSNIITYKVDTSL